MHITDYVRHLPKADFLNSLQIWISRVPKIDFWTQILTQNDTPLWKNRDFALKSPFLPPGQPNAQPKLQIRKKILRWARGFDLSEFHVLAAILEPFEVSEFCTVF